MNQIQTLSYRHSIPHTIIAALTALVVVSVCLYGVLIFTIVHHVAFRQHAESTISEKTIRISELQSEYIVTKSAIDASMASQNDFRAVAVKSYVTSHSLGLSFRPLE